MNLSNKFLISLVDEWLESYNKKDIKGRFFIATVYNPKYNIRVTAQNNVIETKNPLMHAEIAAITKAVEKAKDLGISPFEFLSKSILISSHKPCLMCMSGAYWSGITEVYYIFDYDDTEILFNVSGDSTMLSLLVNKSDVNPDSPYFTMKQIKGELKDTLSEKLLSFYKNLPDNIKLQEKYKMI